MGHKNGTCVHMQAQKGQMCDSSCQCGAGKTSLNISWVLKVISLVSNQTEPADEIMVLIALATSQGSGEPEPSLFAHMKYGSRRRVGPKLRHLATLDGCTFEE